MELTLSDFRTRKLEADRIIDVSTNSNRKSIAKNRNTF